MPFGTTKERTLARDGGLRVIRRRLIVAMLTQFTVLMGLAAIEAFAAPSPAGHGFGVALLIGAAAILPAIMALLARRVLAPVEDLAVERRRLIDLYGQARADSLVDVLTGLGNHRAFQEELGRQLDAAKRHNRPLALLIIDVDDLKKVNDERGHASGDQLLAAVGRITSSVLRRSDRAFRVGGDEFAALLPSSDVSSGLAVARRILASALNGADPGNPIRPFSVSIGVSAYPLPSKEPHQLYRQADAALYWCKRHGRTSAVVYDPGRHGSAADDRSVTELSAAVGEVLASRALRPMYQPIFSLVTGKPVGFEGLVRPAEGSPFGDAASLFAAAEIADRTVDLDLACLEIVSAGVGTLEPDIYLSVNLSPRTLESDLFRPAELVGIFRRRGISAQQVLLELTEREKVEDLDQLRKNVDACRRAGFRLAADDVGSGNAGLRLLSEVHFDTVKIDLSLVQGGIVHDPTHGVLRAIQELAKQWNASIVAEGVETPEQLAVIRKLGIAAGQGYLLGRPSKTRAAEPLDLDDLVGAPPAWSRPAATRWPGSQIARQPARISAPAVTGAAAAPQAVVPPAGSEPIPADVPDAQPESAAVAAADVQAPPASQAGAESAPPKARIKARTRRAVPAEPTDPPKPGTRRGRHVPPLATPRRAKQRAE